MKATSRQLPNQVAVDAKLFHRDGAEIPTLTARTRTASVIEILYSNFFQPPPKISLSLQTVVLLAYFRIVQIPETPEAALKRIIDIRKGSLIFSTPRQTVVREDITFRSFEGKVALSVGLIKLRISVSAVVGTHCLD